MISEAQALTPGLHQAPMSPLDLVKLTSLMQRTSGRTEILIGLIDGPVAMSHPDLGGTRIQSRRTERMSLRGIRSMTYRHYPIALAMDGVLHLASSWDGSRISRRFGFRSVGFVLVRWKRSATAGGSIMASAWDRFWAKIVGAPARALARRLSGRLPRRSHDGILLAVWEPELIPRAEEFFERTSAALRLAASVAPNSYANLKRDLSSIVLWSGRLDSRYHAFQRAALVAPKVAFESESSRYAAWLLYVSGLSRSRDEALSRSREFLEATAPVSYQQFAVWVSKADSEV